MKKIVFLIATCLLFFCVFARASTYTLSVEDTEKIGEKIWKNECGGTIEGLTHWKKGENFPSLGIGHFIWYPANSKERFHETFPALLDFFQTKGEKLPDWLTTNCGCPWSSREEFYQKIDSPQMKSLRKLLLDTKHLQATFIIQRIVQDFPEIIAACSEEEKKAITRIFDLLTCHSKGWYALIDYLNFKGAGISPKERYKGQGWGLHQVLLRIPVLTQTPLEDFVQAAKEVLRERVQNAPPERHEERWLKGWFNRLDTYLIEE